MSLVAAATVVASIYSANAQKKASDKASNIQANASQSAIDEQQRQFDATQALLAPFVQGGTSALKNQQDLLGLNGPDAQSAAIAAIQNGGQYGTLVKQGENAILQNASATGGLRGGNIQSSLANFRPALLNQLIGQQFSNLGNLSSMGQAAAAGQAQLGQSSANSISTLLGQLGQAQAGGALAQGAYGTNIANSISQGVGQLSNNANQAALLAAGLF